MPDGGVEGGEILYGSELSGITFKGSAEDQSKLIAAIAKARLSFGKINRDRIGQYGGQRFPYATLGSLTEATAEALAAEGVVVMFFPCMSRVDRNKHRLEAHVAGHGATLITGLDFAPRADAGGEGERKVEWIKEYGKLQTYLMRYIYRALFALDSEPDADEAPEPERRSEPRREAPRPEPRQEAKRAENAPQARPEPSPAPMPAPAAAQPARPPEPRVEHDDDPGEPPSHELLLAISKLLDGTQKGKIQWNQWCVDATGVPLAVMKQSKARAQAFLEHLQKQALQQQNQAGALP